MKSNCYIWSFKQWLLHGGKIRLIKSRTWVGWHAVWIDQDGICWEYTQPRMRKKPWWYIPLFYNGVIKKCNKNSTLLKDSKKS